MTPPLQSQVDTANAPALDRPDPVASQPSPENHFRTQWQALTAASDNLYAQYQSPDWFDHLAACRIGALPTPLVVHDDQSRLVGVVPFEVRNLPLAFSAKGFVFGRFALRAVVLMGGPPLAQPRAELHDRIYETLAERNPSADCLYLHSVRVGSFAWHHLQNSPRIQERFIPYLPRGVVPFHSLLLPETVEQYLQQQFRAKKRYNLNRQLRLLREHFGEVRCERIDTREKVPMLRDAAALVLPEAWQRSLMNPELYEVLASEERLLDLAGRGLLRSYVLLCGGTPRALVLGYQHNGIYHYAEIAYGQSAAHLSPGNSLLFLLIQDLIEHDRPRCLNLGIGHAEYKRIFGNVHGEDATVILFRRTAMNRVRRFTHRAFTSAIRALKARRRQTS
jgi:CelD/BcsL family acetyltransferase involved in cellulose biosynthesis